MYFSMILLRVTIGGIGILMIANSVVVLYAAQRTRMPFLLLVGAVRLLVGVGVVVATVVDGPVSVALLVASIVGYLVVGTISSRRSKREGSVDDPGNAQDV